MIIGILSFLFGILVLQQFSFLPSILWCLGLLLIIPLAATFFRFKLFLWSLLFIIGFLWALLRAHWVLDVALPNDLQGKDLLIIGVVASIPNQTPRKRRFEFDIETLQVDGVPRTFSSKVRLSWYKRGKRNKQISSLKAGQRWQFWVRLKQPHGFMNLGGFDYEGWLYSKKIRATGYVRINYKKKQFAQLLDKTVTGYKIQSVRQDLYDKLKKQNHKNDFSGIITALAIGERSGISPNQWQVFRATGTSHLVAISGLHIGLLATFIFFITRRIWPYLGPLALKLAAPRAAALSAIAIAALYAALSGFAVPSQRALIMLCVVMLSLFWRQKIQSSQVLSFALLLVLIIDPIAVISPGFWLSFSAVAIISFSALGRLSINTIKSSWHSLTEVGRIQWRISLGLIPLLIFLFQQASVVSPLANIFAIPVVSILVVPLVLVASVIMSLLPEVAGVLFSLSEIVLNALWWFLNGLADRNFSEWFAIKPSLFALILASMGLLLLISPKGWPVKFMGVFMILPLFWPKLDHINEAEAEITLLDVGQGLAVVVQTQNHTLLFDTGPRFSQSFDTGAAVIVPFLRQKGISELDMLVVSHKDNDHSGGLASIQQSIKIKKLISSYPLEGASACVNGQTWKWDKVVFRILNPKQGLKVKKRNNRSCVLKVSVADESVLLSADIEKKTEKHLVLEQPGMLKSTYLIAPHHGSKTSSSAVFLEAVQPAMIMIPVGYRNRYKMPHKSVIKRYQTNAIKYYQTYKTGAMSITLGQKNSTQIPKQTRLNHQKYWNSRH
ncbi:MAG: DNA internalization-related competence protein ComEC/Rec2 [Woeseiaceae bacterium]